MSDEWITPQSAEAKGSTDPDVPTAPASSRPVPAPATEVVPHAEPAAATPPPAAPTMLPGTPVAPAAPAPFDPGAAATQVGRPGAGAGGFVPPAADFAPPGYSAPGYSAPGAGYAPPGPSYAPPTAGYSPTSAAYAPPHGSGGGSGGRLAIILAGVTLVLVLVGGGIAAALLLRDDDSEPDEPGLRAAESTQPAVDPEDAASTEPAGPSGLDPVQVRLDLQGVADGLFPASATAETFTVWNWATTPDNLVDGYVRELSEPEWSSGTQWQVARTLDQHTFTIYVEHLASDYGPVRALPDCGRAGGSDTSLEYCEVHATAAGDVYEQVYQFGDAVYRYLELNGDYDAAVPDVTISESTPGTYAGGDYEPFKMALEDVLATIGDPRLDVALPDQVPPLPSYAACAYATTPPSTCPADIVN